MSNVNNLLRVFTLNELKNDKSEPPKPIISDGILLPNNLLLISGEKKVGKSMLSLNIALSIASGKSFACFNIYKPKRVLYLSAEGGYYPNKERILKMASQFKETTEDNFKVIFNSNLKLNNENDFQILQKIVVDTKTEILVIDPFIKFHTADENSASEMIRVLNKIRNLINEQNISVILIHHLGKNSFNGARGSSVITGEYDSSIQITKSDEFIKLSFELRHAEAPDNIKLKFNKEYFTFEFTEYCNNVNLIRNFEDKVYTRTEMKNYILENNICNSISSAYKFINSNITKGRLIVSEDKKIRIAS